MPTDRSTLTMTPAIYQILLSLADAERHGYGIMQEVAQRTEDEVRLGPGTLYRSIKQMRKAGLIEATETDDRLDEDGDRRRFYRISKTGRRALEEEAERLARLVAQARGKRVIDELGRA
jgi:DNA-binding PadR family transcriptional regulator